MKFLLPAFIALAVLPAAAHHPFTPYYDGARPGSVTGVIVELRSINPHVVLVVDGLSTDGRSGLWAFEGKPPNALQRQGAKDYKERLQPGTRITIAGWPARDPNARAFSAGLVTFADGSTLAFGTAPGSGAEWSCVGPCSYQYPAPRPQ